MVLNFGIQNHTDQDFFPEALKLLQQIHDGLLELSHNYSAPKMRNLVRATHTIKSAAAQVNLTDIQTLAHRLEKIFRLLSLGNTKIDAQLTTLLLEADESLGWLLIAQMQGKFGDVANILAKAEPVFAHLETRLSYNLQIVADPPQNSDIGTEASELIAIAQVTQALENVEMILAQAEADKLAVQLIAQANLFLGFGKSLKISEFVAIAQITITTLQSSPQAAQTIGQLALAGWRTAYDQVLNPQAGKASLRSVTVVSQDTHHSALPRKITTDNLFVWVAGGNVFTLNSNSVEELLVAEADQIIYSKQQRFLHWRGRIIPTYQISNLLRCDTSKSFGNHQAQPMLVLCLNREIIALEPEIEYLIAEPELVINPIPAENKFPSYVYGCINWQDNQLQVIDVAALLQQTIKQSQEVHSTAKLSNSPGAAIVNQQPIILVVDDSNSVRHLISLTLQRAGYKVLQAENGQEAIAQLQQNPSIQIVICDIEMPKMNGFEFLRYRLKNPGLAKVPVIMLSSCTTNQHRLLAMQLGASTYFQKPYVEEEFLTALKMSVA